MQYIGIDQHLFGLIERADNIFDAIQIDSNFFTQFLPYVSDASLKVYMFGLYCCNNSNSKDNSLAKFSAILNLSEEDIISCFYEWEELGLVTIVQKNPFEVRYLPISNGSIKLKKFNTQKFINS